MFSVPLHVLDVTETAEPKMSLFRLCAKAT